MFSNWKRIDPFQRLQAEAFLHNMKAVDLEHHPPSPEALEMLPPGVARKHRIIPVARVQDPSGRECLVIAVGDPSDIAALDAAVDACLRPVRPVLAFPEQITQALDLFYGDDGATRTE